MGIRVQGPIHLSESRPCAHFVQPNSAEVQIKIRFGYRRSEIVKREVGHIGFSVKKRDFNLVVEIAAQVQGSGGKIDFWKVDAETRWGKVFRFDAKRMSEGTHICRWNDKGAGEIVIGRCDRAIYGSCMDREAIHFDGDGWPISQVH